MTKFLEEILTELDRLNEKETVPSQAMVFDGLTTRHYMVWDPDSPVVYRVIKVKGTKDLSFFKELPNGVDDDVDLDDKVKEFCFHMSNALKEVKDV